MKRDEIRSDRGRKLVLSRALSTAAQQGAYGAGLVDPTLITHATELDTNYRQKLSALSLLFSKRRQKIEARLEIMQALGSAVRKFWNGLEFRGQLLGLSSGILEIYRLPSDNGRPHPSNQQAWLEAANELVEGEKKAVEAGHPAMESPTIDSVATLLAEAREVCAKTDEAELAYLNARKELQEQRDLVDQLIFDLSANLNFKLVKLPAPARREVMRRYGFTYRDGNLTTLEPEPQTETEPEPQEEEQLEQTSPQLAISA